MQFEWNDQRQKVFNDRYALKADGIVKETKVSQMQERVAIAISHNESEKQEFRDILKDFHFLPAGRILSGAGSKQHSATFYNCFVMGIDPVNPSHGKDSRDAILNSISKMVEINCRGGGVGINWSVLRPDKSSVKGVQGSSSGPVGWMKGADALADQVRQGGSRTAALMFILNDWHPDILNFINRERFLRANFSVAISDDFMDALYSGEMWTLSFPDTSDPAYDILWDGDINRWKADRRRTITKSIDPKEIWKAICESAIRCGSPGLVFIDRCNQLSNTFDSERLVCTNPCGEQPLPEYGACNLGSINLTSICNANGDINKQELSKIIESAILFLDNVIDKSPPLYPEIDRLQKLYRRIGLGTMGLADVLILNKLRYGSDESLDFISELFSFIQQEAYKADFRLASERRAAPKFSSKFMDSHTAHELGTPIREGIAKYGLRNTSILTQAPTGTISILAGVNSGIEPVFNSKYIRRDATGEHYMKHPLFIGEGEHLVTAHEILPLEHLKVQATLQRFIDSSISKTINLPSHSDVIDVATIFRQAWELNCKGVTIYRDGSLNNVLSPEDKCPNGSCEFCSM